MGRKKNVDTTFTSVLENNQIEDVRWLCSLSESELDMLIMLKMMVLRRAKKIGHVSLAKEFDLKVLRRLCFTMMEHLKEELKDLSARPDSVDVSKLLDKSNLSKPHVNDSFASKSYEELWECICPENKKRILELFSEDTTPLKKGRAAKEGSSQQS
ncbi:hypothetical protein ACH5RR_009319 [Cinchona calisaya]|uniref:Uncharacterized protein n=1 Tax=Cinchona calisaya TaxID=153742 RepID=A0ABD3AHD0_9GENT